MVGRRLETAHALEHRDEVRDAPSPNELGDSESCRLSQRFRIGLDGGRDGLLRLGLRLRTASRCCHARFTGGGGAAAAERALCGTSACSLIRLD